MGTSLEDWLVIRRHNRGVVSFCLGFLVIFAVLARPSALVTFGFIAFAGTLISQRSQRI